MTEKAFYGTALGIIVGVWGFGLVAVMGALAIARSGSRPPAAPKRPGLPRWFPGFLIASWIFELVGLACIIYAHERRSVPGGTSKAIAGSVLCLILLAIVTWILIDDRREQRNKGL